MSGTTSSTGSARCCGSFFYDNTVTIAAALDLQTATQAALAQSQAALAASTSALEAAQQAVTDANYFLSGDLRGLPTTPGIPGTLWNNGGEIALAR